MASPDASVGLYRLWPRLKRPAGLGKVYDSITPREVPPRGSKTVTVPVLSILMETAFNGIAISG